MIWPVPVGVRVRSNFKTMFLAQLADCGGESAEISNFAEYEHRLNAAQKLQLRAIAERIVFSCVRSYRRQPRPVWRYRRANGIPAVGITDARLFSAHG